MHRKRQAVFLCVCMHGGRREGGQVCLNMDSHILDFPKWVRTYSTSHSQRTSNAYPQGMAVHCCWWLMRWTSNFTPRRWNHWNEDMKALAKADTFFFFFKDFGFKFITRTEICFLWQKIHFTHKTHISLACFPFRQALQDKCVLQFTSSKKDKGLETPQVHSPNYRSWHFFFIWQTIYSD